MAKYGLFGNVNGQAEQRRAETFLDQHGREYAANVEISTGDPCSVLAPMGWTAPVGPEWFRGMLMPPEHLRQMVPRQERARKRYQIHINYEQWLTELDQRNDAWEQRLADLARSSTKGLGFAEMIDNPPAALLDYLGPKAFPPRVFVEAMAAGDRWSLGMSDRIPARAVLLLREVETLVKKRRPARAQIGVVNPFADEEDERDDGQEWQTAQTVQANPLADVDDVDDLDELFDPDAKGGRTEKVRRGAKR